MYSHWWHVRYYRKLGTKGKTFKYTLKGQYILLYINWKQFSGAIVAYHTILILLKGHFTIKKRRPSVWRASEKICKMYNSAVVCGLAGNRWRSRRVQKKNFHISKMVESRKIPKNQHSKTDTSLLTLWLLTYIPPLHYRLAMLILGWRRSIQVARRAAVRQPQVRSSAQVPQNMK